jgi:hypothetical protein
LNKVGLDESTSLSSRAFELYVQQKAPLKVACELNLEADKAIHYYHEYFKLLGITEFTRVYLQVKDNPMGFVRLFELSQKLGMGNDEVVELLKIANGHTINIFSHLGLLDSKVYFFCVIIYQLLILVISIALLIELILISDSYKNLQEMMYYHHTITQANICHYHNSAIVVCNIQFFITALFQYPKSRYYQSRNSCLDIRDIIRNFCIIIHFSYIARNNSQDIIAEPIMILFHCHITLREIFMPSFCF